ncbi:hypothetical protein JRQ81_013458 [Phrynocephalus forsythii]|uniref:Uncharacterized protein n=1 Tax=Phrynocephalus forsythii TaxID=171643 RepID=A0A9Q0Y075_9SAUR|nr:hypothetical protein JRQ81_013458 [Phrynocephalus forsythii]
MRPTPPTPKERHKGRLLRGPDPQLQRAGGRQRNPMDAGREDGLGRRLRWGPRRSSILTPVQGQ